MSPVAWCLAWVGGTWMVIAIAAAWIKHRNHRRPPLPQRTPADVYRDVDTYRAARIAEQAADEDDFYIGDDELADQLAIWTADYRAGCDRLRDEINKQQKGEES